METSSKITNDKTATAASSDELPASMPHPRYPGYTVDRDGIIRDKDGSVIKPSLHGYYPVVNIDNKLERVHVLVCEAFCGLRPCDTCEVHHDDENRLNFRASNLYWLPRKQHRAMHRHKAARSEKQISVPAKPYAGFPLNVGLEGEWCRRMGGARRCFGHWQDDPKGEKALAAYVAAGGKDWASSLRAADLERLLILASPIMRPMILLALNLGTGPGGVADLRWDDLDLATGRIVYRGRKVVLWSVTQEALTRLPRRGPLVFYTRHGNPFIRRPSDGSGSSVASLVKGNRSKPVKLANGNALSQSFRRLAAKAGLPGLTFSDLRVAAKQAASFAASLN